MFDVLVIGAGHAGCEAASAAARRGARVGLITFDAHNIGQLSCNPSIGGVGKGHLVRELDVFDGLMARAADRASIHRRMLNRSKGSAVHGPRVQADRQQYQQAVRHLLELSKVELVAGEVAALRMKGFEIAGVELASGESLSCRAVVVSSGTFLGAALFCGMRRMDGGRVGERASTRLADQFRDLGLVAGRLKTGTPPRLDGRTIDWARLERQPSERASWFMSSLSREAHLPQVDCAITRTTGQTHDIIQANLDRSPLFSNAIEGRGPRYCPSIEDKVKRFTERESHQIFLEPEGLASALVYPNGISTSLPKDVQAKFVRSIPGLEHVAIVQPGYAVEYAYFDPRRLNSSLEHQEIGGLFLAGQINGTTGYEEAAAQGLAAGLNAAARACGLAPVLFDRASSYIGVMIDDLTLQGVTEPYRMMTARAEFRLHLRADNASTRLGQAAKEANCIGPERRQAIERHAQEREASSAQLEEKISEADLSGQGSSTRRSYREWLLRPERRDAVVDKLAKKGVTEEVIIDAEYAPYLSRQRREWETMLRDASVQFPMGFEYDSVPGISTEMAERLIASKPQTLGEASRIRGISPAALSALHFAVARAA